ncbi:amino acid adenylation domain-containing protein [Chromobacterium sp. CV08]|uniref:non-ribosomal peptide synthetase n=1 Tax=Chromobacterium sp. CV08 TaxID=3133274 RepID=UPI003DA85C29
MNNKDIASLSLEERKRLLERAKASKLQKSAAPESAPLSAGQHGDAAALSFAQQRFWFLSRLDGGSRAYHIHGGLRLSGELDREALARALADVVDRHQALRARFVDEDGRATQQFAPPGTIAALAFEDLRQQADPEQACRERAEREAAQSFDLRRGPLIRGRLLQLAEREHVLLLTLHHIVADGWSMGILVGELSACYAARRGGTPPALPPLPVQYADYAAWQRAWMEKDAAREQAAYWKAALAGAPALLELPHDKARPAQQQFAGGSVAVDLDQEVSERLRRFCLRHGVTPFMVLLSSWALLLARLSGQDDVVVGTPVAGRNRSEFEPLIGLFVNTLPLRLQTGGWRDAAGWLGHVKQRVLESQRHADLPFDQIVEAVKPPRSLAYSPLFQTIFSWQNTPPGQLSLPGVDWRELPAQWSESQVDLELHLRESEGRIVGRIVFAASLFEPATVERYGRYWRKLLQGMLDDDGVAPGRIAMLPDAERRLLLDDFNATAAPYPEQALVHQLFEAQAAERPDAPALYSGDETLSYCELNRRANRLAHRLIALGVGPDARVALCLERGVDMVAALLAVLKAGGAYVPLDPSYPAERLAYMLDDSAPRVVLSQHSLQALTAGGERTVLLLDDEAERARQAALPDGNPAVVGLGNRHAAYVIYTSGSTGRPKGVVNEHRGVVNRLWWAQDAYRLRADDLVLQKTPFGFDVSVWEFFLPLLAGAQLLMARPEGHKDPQYLRQLIESRGVTMLHFVPSMLQAFVSLTPAGSCPSLRRILCSGEALPHALQEQCLRHFPHSELHNLYGPTEAAIDVTAWPCVSDPSRHFVPIGKPIANIRMYVLDSQLQPTPLGVAGEIHIGGVGVARGYLNRPELTAERFIADPFSADADARLYKTGDLGRWLPDGSIEYLGRNDFQVKLRGFRIELGEIEARLAACAGVREAAVLAREDAPGDKRLVAYLTARPDAAPDAAALRTELAKDLAEYMIPSAFVVLDAFPLTPNGKLDRKALPAPDGAQLTSREYAAPQGEAEEALANIWSALLNVERVGRHDNFFELGGHSLLAVQLVERMRQAGLHCDIRQLFGASDLAALAAGLGGGDEVAVPANGIPAEGCAAITPAMLPLVALEQTQLDRIADGVAGGMANIQDIYPLAPLQEGILFHHLLGGEGDAYLLSCLMAFDSGERLQGFVAALQQVVARHDILRTAIQWRDLPEPVQVVWRQAPVAVETVALDPADGPVGAQLERRYDPRRTRLDVTRAPLLRGYAAADPADGRHYLQLLFHHLAIDQTSLSQMLQEVRQLQRGDAELAPSLPFRNFVAQARLGIGAAEHEAYFRAELGEIDEPTAAFGLQDNRGDGGGLDESRLRLPAELTDRLRRQARRLGVSVASLAHLAWGRLLARASGRNTVVFGTVLFGRLQGGAGADRALGLFINTLPLKLELGGASVDEAAKQTQQALTRLLRHEHAPLALAQRCSGVAAPLPLFSALLNYRHGSDGDEREIAGDGITVLADQSRTNYPLTMSVDDFGDAGLALQAQVPATVGAARVCAQMERTLTALADALEAGGGESVSTLEVLPNGERHLLLDVFNATAAPYPEQALVHQLFEAQAAERPDAPALYSGDETLSYGELNRRANRLAHRLIALGVGPDARVALCLERGVDMVAALLGVLKAGGAYVPLDPSYPAERLAYMLDDSAPRVVLSQHSLQALTAGGERTVLLLDDEAERARQAALPDGNPAVVGLGNRHAAYVIYTSGSTGRPKGVVNEHRGVVNRLWWAQDAYRLRADDLVLQKTPFGFDVSVWEFFLPLLAGAQLLMARPEGHKDPQYLRQLIESRGVTMLHFVPSMLQAFVSLTPAGSCPSLRRILCSGEALPHALQEQCLRHFPHSELHNLYGPTEAAIDVTAWPCVSDPSRHFVPIGKPIANIRMYVLDSQLQPTPLGVAGEIHIGGVGVARGYLNRPELTAERFIADPFSADADARLYKTGDLGRWLPDGSIEYLGRNDFQVKLRGFRIELGEIEARLAACAGVREAAVLAREDAPGDKRLVAYLTARPDAAPDAAALRTELAKDLAEYMIPSAFVVLDAFPLTPNGKLDRKALPAPDGAQLTSREYAAPQGEAEEALANIWSALLNVERVGRHDNFFELGGHSLLAVQLVERMRQAGLHCDIRQLFGASDLAALAAGLGGGGDEVAVPANGIPAEGCAAITPAMLPLVALEQTQLDRIADGVAGGMANIQDIYPLAPLQEGILFHHLLGGEGDAYLLSCLMAFDSGERLQGFVAALQQVVARHDILRTAIQWRDLPEPVQVVWRQAPVAVETVALDPADGPVGAQLERRYDPRRTRLDVTRAPLLRGYVAADPADGRHYLQLLFHHLAVDHATLELLLQEVRQLQRGDAELAPSLPFRNFVAQARLGIGAAEHEAYFRGELGEIDEPTAAFGLQDNRGDGGGLDESRLRLPSELTDRLRRQARRLGVSVASLAHLAWGRLLARASGRNAVVFGTVLFGRLQGGAGADRALGLFINTLPLKLSFDGLGVEEAARRTQQALTRLLRHEHAPLALAQRCSQVAAPLPLFSALLNYRHSTEDEAGLPGWEGIEVLGGEERSNYPLTMSVDDFGDAGLALQAQVPATVGAARVCAQMERTLTSLADALEAGGGMAARALEVLPDAEKRLLLDEFNAASVPYPDDVLIHQLFEAQAAERPDAPALLYGDEALSYGELNRRANRLAHRLIALGVGPDDKVALCLERSVDIVAALLGVLKAGGAYVPLDPSYPAERLAYMLDDSAPKAVLTQASLRALSAGGDRAVVLLDEEAERLAALPAGNPRVAGLNSRHPAYVIYTSGSTGRPKGVVCAHYGVVHLMRSLSGIWPMTPDSRVLQFASFSFDASVWEYAGALSSGAALCLATREERMPGGALQDTLRRFRISHTLLPSSALKMMDPAAIGYRIENLLVGGEACPVALAESWARVHRLFNVYGPTESTIYATYHRCRTDQAGVLPIGKPLPNIRAYILDADLQPVPLGVAGEIHIGGPGVTHGYLNRPGLSAQRFVADPYGGETGARLYKTGDLGRWLPDGSIEYLGRNDFQVKIRGFRIELGEIEAKLAACAGVTEAVVLAREDASGDKRLVAYLTARPDAALNAAVLRAELARELTEYMVPSAFVVLDAFPLTPNGKLDRKALPAPDGAQLTSREYVPPLGETEAKLAAIWRALLGVERVGRHDNFFELGGHSLLAVRLVEQMRQAGLRCDIRQLFGAADLAALAEAIATDGAADQDWFAESDQGPKGDIEELVL